MQPMTPPVIYFAMCKVDWSIYNSEGNLITSNPTTDEVYNSIGISRYGFRVGTGIFLSFNCRCAGKYSFANKNNNVSEITVIVPGGLIYPFEVSLQDGSNIVSVS